VELLTQSGAVFSSTATGIAKIGEGFCKWGKLCLSVQVALEMFLLGWVQWWEEIVSSGFRRCAAVHSGSLGYPLCAFDLSDPTAGSGG
jgi:hypothetical protein